MKKGYVMYTFSDKVMGFIAAVALFVTGMSVNKSCMWFLGQDKMPDNYRKLRKF